MTNRTRVDINVVHVDSIPEGVIADNGKCFPQNGRATQTQVSVDEATVHSNRAAMYACDCVKQVAGIGASYKEFIEEVVQEQNEGAVR